MYMLDRTTALMQAFIPGESPPDVKTPIFLIFDNGVSFNIYEYKVYNLH